MKEFESRTVEDLTILHAADVDDYVDQFSLLSFHPV